MCGHKAACGNSRVNMLRRFDCTGFVELWIYSF